VQKKRIYIYIYIEREREREREKGKVYEREGESVCVCVLRSKRVKREGVSRLSYLWSKQPDCMCYMSGCDVIFK